MGVAPFAFLLLRADLLFQLAYFFRVVGLVDPILILVLSCPVNAQESDLVSTLPPTLKFFFNVGLHLDIHQLISFKSGMMIETIELNISTPVLRHRGRHVV